MGKFIGLDMSLSGTGIAVIDGEELKLKTVKTKPNDFPNIYRRVDYIIDEILSELNDVEMICIEQPFISKGSMGSNDKLIYLGMSIRKELCYRQIPFFDVHVSHLKIYATGKGNSKKHVMVKAAEMQGIDVKDDNQADAYFLCQIARAIIMERKGQGTTRGKAKEVIDKVTGKF